MGVGRTDTIWMFLSVSLNAKLTVLFWQNNNTEKQHGKKILKTCLATCEEFFKTDSVGFEELDMVGHWYFHYCDTIVAMIILTKIYFNKNAGRSSLLRLLKLDKDWHNWTG